MVATDLGDQQTTQVHTVTLVAENTPPVADAGDDIRQDCSEPCVDAECGTTVTLDASGSSDADDDELTYTWTGPFTEGDGTVTGEVVEVTLPLGTHIITLTVDDGTTTSTDTVEVVIAVKVTGLKPPLAGLVPAGETAPLPWRAFNAGRTLPLRFTLTCGQQQLTADDVAAPEIVGLVDQDRNSVDLSTIDADAGSSNGNTLFFRHDDEQWIYNLSTKDMPGGKTYTLTIRMPDGQDYQARFALREGRVSRRSSGRR